MEDVISIYIDQLIPVTQRLVSRFREANGTATYLDIVQL